jgi:hypothetical protein
MPRNILIPTPAVLLRMRQQMAPNRLPNRLLK